MSNRPAEASGEVLGATEVQMRRPKARVNPEQASIVSCWSRPSCHKGKAAGERGSNRPKNPFSPAEVVGSACADKVFEATCEIHTGGGSRPPTGVT